MYLQLETGSFDKSYEELNRVFGFSPRLRQGLEPVEPPR